MKKTDRILGLSSTLALTIGIVAGVLSIVATGLVINTQLGK